MNYLIAKMKYKNGGFVRVTYSNEQIFELPDISEKKEYTASYKLENEEWFELDNFLARKYENNLIEKVFNSTDFNQIPPEKYSDIEYLCCKQGDVFLFQKVFSNQILCKKWLQISDEPTLNIGKPIVVLNNNIDAMYDKSKDTLYFKDIARIKVMFKGIDILYREATKEEIEIFLKEDFISLVDGFSVKQIKTANRKRIAQTVDILKTFSSIEKKEICEYTQSYCLDVPVKDNVFQISSENQLKHILFGIEQRYYTTVLSKEKRLANSVIAIK